MASRQQEKEERRRARLEAEARERKAAARKKRLQFVLGGALAVGIVAAVVIAVLASGGDPERAAGDVREAQALVDLPEPEILEEQAAADAAGCKVTQVPDEGRDHEDKSFTAADYGSNPPTSGTHYPVPALDGIYDPGKTPPLGETVHQLEHGRIAVQYAPGTSPELIKKLESFLAENDGYHMAMYENTTDMDAAVAATAWDFMITCPKPTPQLWDALRTFRDAHIDRAPEKSP